MQKSKGSYYENQEERLKVKNLNQKMINLAVQGTGISPWEAEVLVQLIEKVYFREFCMREFLPGQIKYQCISSEEGPGKALLLCKMVIVTLTIHDPTDKGDFSSDSNKARIIELRRRRLARIADEAKEQGGFLSQEDLAELLMCDSRTIRRDIKELKKLGIIIPSRGQQKDIGPGVTHKAIAIRHWLEGKEPVEIARLIKHSIKAIENYLEKFKRVCFLKGKKFSELEIALTIGISVSSTKSFVEIFNEYRNKAFFDQRIQEINLVGGQYWDAQDEKKNSTSSNENLKPWRKQ